MIGRVITSSDWPRALAAGVLVGIRGRSGLGKSHLAARIAPAGTPIVTLETWRVDLVDRLRRRVTSSDPWLEPATLVLEDVGDLVCAPATTAHLAGFVDERRRTGRLTVMVEGRRDGTIQQVLEAAGGPALVIDLRAPGITERRRFLRTTPGLSLRGVRAGLDVKPWDFRTALGQARTVSVRAR